MIGKKQLAEWFTAQLVIDYYQWRLRRRKKSKRGTRYKSLITRHGGVDAMKLLLASRGNRRKRSEFGAEYYVTLKRFRPLFTVDELREARRRLTSKA